MASSAVAIANIALSLLGQQPILSFTDDSNRARMVNLRYEDIRDAVLRSHLWNSAMKRVSLSKNATDPVWGYDNAYDLPADFIRLASMHELGIDYRIEGRQLVTENSSAKILYVARITDVNTMDELLKQAIAARLAAELSLPLTGSESHARMMWRLWQDKLDEARYVDAIEGPTDLDIRPSVWLEQRAVGTLEELAQRKISGS